MILRLCAEQKVVYIHFSDNFIVDKDEFKLMHDEFKNLTPIHRHLLLERNLVGYTRNEKTIELQHAVDDIKEILAKKAPLSFVLE